MNRRKFLHSTVASAVVLARSSRALAADTKYDLIIKGGRVIDPSLRLDAVRDIAVAGGRIAAVEARIAAEAAETIDAAGKLVVPGLIDIHTHAARGADGPPLCLLDGVTGWIDAGSAGADGIAAAVAVAKGSPQTGRVLINIGRAGIIPEGDTTDLTRADMGVARDAIARNREYVVGVKARLSSNVAGPNDYEVLKRAEEAAGGLPVMIHMGQTASPLAKLFPLLKRGDIVTHMFAPPPNAIIDESGRILPEVLAARRRGVIFDVGNGVRDHIRWDLFDRIMQAGFWPDTISTDWNVMSRTTGVVDFPNCMSKMLGSGMSLAEVVAAATVNAARTFAAFNDRGTLNVGAPADVAILELREGSFEFLDNYDGKRTGRQRLFPSTTVLAGKRVRAA
jgi:dihydroorotase